MDVILTKKNPYLIFTAISLAALTHSELPIVKSQKHSSQYSVFTKYAQDGSPVIWDQEQEIKVVIYGVHTTDPNWKLVEKSLKWLERELGVKSRVIGGTGIVASTNWFKVNTFGSVPPVNISFVQRQESDLLLDPAAIAAAVANPSKGLHPRIVTGAIAIDRVAITALTSGKKELVLRHELGHLVGFGHEISDLMNPELGDCSCRTFSRKKNISVSSSEH
jgi:hypothetical protein